MWSRRVRKTMFFAVAMVTSAVVIVGLVLVYAGIIYRAQVAAPHTYADAAWTSLVIVVPIMVLAAVIAIAQIVENWD